MNELFSQVSIEKPDIITPQKIFPRNSSEVIDVKRDYKIPYYELIVLNGNMKREEILSVTNMAQAMKADFQKEFDGFM